MQRIKKGIKELLFIPMQSSAWLIRYYLVFYQKISCHSYKKMLVAEDEWIRYDWQIIYFRKIVLTER